MPVAPPAAKPTLHSSWQQLVRYTYLRPEQLPAPLWRFTAIGRGDRREERADAVVLPRRHSTPDTLAGHLEFALKWEGIELPLLKQLFKEAALK